MSRQELVTTIDPHQDVLDAGERTLSELAAELRRQIDAGTKAQWEVGRIASIARARCEDPTLADADGYPGKNPDERFGRWVSLNFGDTPQQSLFNWRRTWECFGRQREAVAFIPASGLYLLAQPQHDERRGQFVEALSAIRRAKLDQYGETDPRSRVTVAEVESVTKGLHFRAQGTGENEWYTPAEYVEAAREVLGAFDLDPASSEYAQRTVRAAKFFTVNDDGLKQEWGGRVWLNPPYAQPAIANFIDKLLLELREGRTTSAILLTHNYTDTGWFHAAAGAANAICFTRGRIRFVSPDGGIAAPTQGQAFFYFGPDVDVFAGTFKRVGFVLVAA